MTVVQTSRSRRAYGARCLAAGRNRRGSALLIVTIAAAVIAMFTLTVSRSTIVHSLEVDATKRFAEARLASDTAFTYALTRLKAAPASRGVFADAGLQTIAPDARYECIDAGTGLVEIRVYVSATSTAPFSQRVVDPLTL